jgi:hypothetical protein
MERYRARRRQIEDYLGGECARCGATTKLQVDHKDKWLKSFNISQFWSLSWDKLKVELDKCQLLCKSCHKIKSDEEKDWGVLGFGPTHHGTDSMYKEGCRCRPCKNAYNKAAREYRQLQRLNRILEEDI